MTERAPVSAPDVVVHRILPADEFSSLDEYVAAGGGAGRTLALDMDAASLIDVVTTSGLRGRGGAGFPTGTKWSTVAGASASDALPTTVVVNGAEGEPGTFKDRAILRANPYAVLEGAVIAARAVGAPTAVIALKASFAREVERVERAIAEMEAAGWVDRGVLSVFRGPRRVPLRRGNGDCSRPSPGVLRSRASPRRGVAAQPRSSRTLTTPRATAGSPPRS